MQLFDHYSFRARLQPALFTLLPLALGVFAWTGTKTPWMSIVWTFCGTAGATYFFAVVVRNRGKQIEPGLWQSWQGSPTVQLLRHSGRANPVMRERWHKYLAKLLGTGMPNAKEETTNPVAADQAYEAAVKLLIAKTRDTKKFPLLYKENVSYGFCRNVYAMRPIGILFSVVGFATGIAAALTFARTQDLQILAWACSAINALFLLGWTTRVNAEWVKVPAFAYADRLFETIETLSRAKAKTAVAETTK